MTKMEKACTLSKPLIYFNSEAQLWYMCYHSLYHGNSAWKAGCDLLDKLNGRTE